jgi:DNA-binding transcriptional LysR family regulator
VIEVRHLRYFVAVSEELHFGRAAERLHITQPPLSQAIRKLEDELGVELLRRTSRLVTLTDAGRVFADEARKVIASFDRAVAAAQRTGGGGGSTLHIGCVPNLPVERLLAFLGELRRREPSLSVQVSHLLTLDQIQRLRSAELDLGIFPRAAAHDDLELEPLFPGEELAAFLRPDHLLAGKQVLRPGDLSGETLVTFPRSTNPPLYDLVGERLEEGGYRFAGAREAGGASSRDVLLEVAGGTGVALAPASLRHTSEAGGLVVHRPLDPPVYAPETVIAWPANAHGSTGALVDVLRRIAEDLSGAGEATTPNSS